MKRAVSLISLLIFIYAWAFSAFSFSIDGNDSGVEWDGAIVYKFIDGESNCGVDFGLVKVKFDYNTSSVCFCFHFSDPDLSPDNAMAGISFAIEGSSSFEILASDVTRSYNIDPYDFDGAISLDKNNGATCEVRVGIKSGLPEMIDGSVRFIDSKGYYSNSYSFTVVNEEYEVTDDYIMYPTGDNKDPAFNPDVNYTVTNKKTTKKKTTTVKTTKNKTTKKSSTKDNNRENTIKTSPHYSYTGRISTVRDTTEKNISVKSTKASQTEKDVVTVYYYEKEIYISQVYVTQFSEATSTELHENEELNANNNGISDESKNPKGEVSLSKGTKYKKIISAAGLAAFLGIAVFGTYSARKNSNKTSD